MQTFTGKEYIKIDVANNFGLDKEEWDTRIDWFDSNEDKLDSLVHHADEPALFYAGVMAWKDVKAGKPTGYAISLDGTSSGLQILSVLVRCRKSAETCNIVSTGKRMNAYNVVYKAMCEALSENQKAESSDVKQAIMTALYGSSAVPREVFGEGELLDCFYQIMKEKLPGAWELNQDLLALWQPNTLSHDWVMPDNFHVKNKVMGVESHKVLFNNRPYMVNIAVNKPVKEGKAIGANTCHSIDGMIIREAVTRASITPNQKEKLFDALNHGGDSIKRDQDILVKTLWSHYKESGFLSSRILRYLDKHNSGHVDSKVVINMLDSLPKKNFQIMPVHDCFRVHPNYGNDIRQMYNNIFAEITKSNLLSFIASQIAKRPVAAKLGNDFSNDVYNAEYALS